MEDSSVEVLVPSFRDTAGASNKLGGNSETICEYGGLESTESLTPGEKGNTLSKTAF